MPNVVRKTKFIEKKIDNYVPPPRNNFFAPRNSENELINKHNSKKNQFEILRETAEIRNNLGKTVIGRGFGNLDISNEIRNVNSARDDRQEHRIIKEETSMIEHSFSYLNKDFQNPNNIVMPFARGGEMTRKQHDVRFDNFRKTGNELQKEIKHYEFQY